MNKYDRLGKNSLLIFVGSIGSKLLSVLMLPFYTSWLSVEKYGDVDLVTTYVSLIMGVVTLCMTDAIFRFPQGKDFAKQRAFFSSGIALVAASVALFGLIYFGVLALFDCSTWGVFSAYSTYIYVFLIFSFLQLYLQQFSRSIGRMSVFVVSGILLTVVTAAVSFLLVPSYGANGYLLSQLIGLAAASTYTIRTIRAYAYVSFRAVSSSVIREMVSYSVPMIPNATLWWILGTSNRLFLEYYRGVETVGIFAVSNRFPSVVTMVFNTFFLSWQISVLEEYEKVDFAIFYNNVMRLCFSLLIGISILLSLGSYWLVSFFASHEYLDAWRYIPFLGVAAVFSAFSTFAGTMFMASKKTRYFLTTSLWGGITCLVLNVILIRSHGIMGATLSLLIAHFVILSLRVAKADRFVVLRDKRSYLSQIVIAVALAWIMIAGLPLLPAFGMALVMIAAFVCLNFRYVLLGKDKLYQLIRSRHVS